MKNRNIALAILLLFPFINQVQAQTETSRMQLKAVQFAHGFSLDAYGNQMSMDWMKARTGSEDAFVLDLSQFSADVWTATAGCNLNGQLAFHTELKGSPELRLGLGAVLQREAVIDFQDKSNGLAESYMYCFVENELTSNAELIWRKQMGRFAVYGGVGANAAGSFNNTLYRFQNYMFSGRPGNSTFSPTEEGITDEWSGKDVLYLRAYLPLGFSFQLMDHLELTYEQRFGFGVEALIGAQESNHMLVSATNFGIRYNFQEHATESLISRFMWN